MSETYGMGLRSPLPPNMAQPCPRCEAEFIPAQGALSRWDNHTKVCPRCGTQEAMLDMAARQAGRTGNTHLDPILGQVVWANPWPDQPSTND